MRFLPTHLTLSGLMAALWIGWAIWANVPHYYDTQEMQNTIATVAGPNNVDLQPANAGFPFAFMQYDYANNGQLTVHAMQPSTLLPNILFSIAGSLGVALLIARTRRISFAAVALLCALLLPAVSLYVLLNGLHPDVISYLYLTPLVMLVLNVASDTIRKQRRKNNGINGSARRCPA
jgi:hypothetical protein